MFRFTRKPLSGSYNRYLAKITHWVQCGYMGVVQTLSVLWLYSMNCEACVLCTTQHTHLTGHTMIAAHTAHTPHRSYNAAIIV
jgi:hypothetical protein